jgi:hypothetical protein
MKNPFKSGKFRAAVYGLSIAILALLSVFGLVTAQVATAIGGVVGALTALLALLNVDFGFDAEDDK